MTLRIRARRPDSFITFFVKIAGLLVAGLLVLAATGRAQSRPQVFDKSDIAYWSASAADVASSIGHREALSRDANGRFDVKMNLILKGGVWAGLKALKFHYREPRDQKLTNRVEYGIAGFFAGVAIYNFFFVKHR